MGKGKVRGGAWLPWYPQGEGLGTVTCESEGGGGWEAGFLGLGAPGPQAKA